MFSNRIDAGKQLAVKLEKYAGKKSVLILAIPRGGLEIGYAIAEELKLPLSIIVTKKIPHPLDEELAVGAVGPNNSFSLNEFASDVPKQHIEQKVKELSSAIKAKYRNYLPKGKPPNVKGKTVILVDDGIATGSTMLAAIQLLRGQKAKKIIAAVPVIPSSAIKQFEKEAEELVFIEAPVLFAAISLFYKEFPQVSDEQAIDYLKKAGKFAGKK